MTLPFLFSHLFFFRLWRSSWGSFFKLASFRASLNELKQRTGSLAQRLWPIEKGEGGLFLQMFLLALLINANYSLLRALRSALVVADPRGEAELIPHYELMMVLPLSIAISAILARLCRRFSLRVIFSITLIFFLLFFLLFAFWIYPRSEMLDQLLAFGEGRGLTRVFHRWTFGLFYGAAELWKVVLLTVLFFGLLNQSLLLKEARRLYAPLMVAGSLGAMLAGPLTTLCTSKPLFYAMPLASEQWHHSLSLAALVVAIIGLAILVLFNRLARQLIAERGSKSAKKIDKRVSLTLSGAFKHLMSSPYLLLLFLIVFSDYITYSFAELLFLDSVGKLFPDPEGYWRYMGRLSFWSGVGTAVMALFVAPLILERMRWRIAALVTPLVVLVSGGLFLLAACAIDAPWFTAFCGPLSPLQVCVALGSLEYCLGRMAKYTLFDATKELAFVPLAVDEQTKGKLVIDGIGSRFGRASSSALSLGLVGLFGSVGASAPGASLLVLFFTLLWIAATFSMGSRFEAITGERSKVAPA